MAGLETQQKGAVLMYRYVNVKETSWHVWEVGGTVVLLAVDGISGVQPLVSTVEYFFFLLLHRSCCFNYLFNIPAHAHTIYTLKALKFTLKHLKICPYMFRSHF
jgi:hypothetical protein